MKKVLVIAAASSLWALPMTVFAHGSCGEDEEHCAYWHDTSGAYVKDSSGSCVRTSNWTEGSQIEGCDIIKKAAPMPVVMAPVDGDGDGVPDSRDACKFTPAGIAVDMRGCPMDSDGDGITDVNDKCPGTAKGKKVDSKGCEVVEYKEVSMKLEVQFPSNSDEVTSAYETQMKALAYVLAADPKSTVVIKGYTDSAGSAAYNKDLSQRRADAVAKRLISQYGVAPSQISAVGYGEAMPVGDNSTAEGRLANRRVEAALVGKVRQ